MPCSSSRFAAHLLLFACAACVTGRGPVETAEAYARALEEGRWEDAAALSTRSAAELESAYASPSGRERAESIRGTRAWSSATAPGLEIVDTREGWRVRDDPHAGDLELSEASSEAARAVLQRFLHASEQGDFAAAHALLSAPLRARYTPERFAKDFSDEPLAKERLGRARAAAAGPPQLSRDEAQFPLGDGRAVRLVREAGGWRVESLE